MGHCLDYCSSISSFTHHCFWTTNTNVNRVKKANALNYQNTFHLRDAPTILTSSTASPSTQHLNSYSLSSIFYLANDIDHLLECQILIAFSSSSFFSYFSEALTTANLPISLEILFSSHTWLTFIVLCLWHVIPSLCLLYFLLHSPPPPAPTTCIHLWNKLVSLFSLSCLQTEWFSSSHWACFLPLSAPFISIFVANTTVQVLINSCLHLW